MSDKIELGTREKHLLKQAESIATDIGYGHVISYLGMRWLDRLEAQGLPRDVSVVNVTPYPKGMFDE